jgi:PAS domain S-box-containing protein
LRPAGVCLLGIILWCYVFYLLQQLSWPPVYMYGTFGLLTAGALYLLLRRFLHAQQYRYMFDKHPIPIWIYEYGTLRFLSANRAAIEKYGYSRKEFLSMTIADIRDSSEAARMLENIRTHSRDQQYSGVWKHRKKDGTGFYVEIFAHDGIYLGRRCRVVMVVDIDAKVRETNEAREMGQRYELLAKATHDVIYDWNIVTNEVIWNHGLSSLFGYAPGEEPEDGSWWSTQLHPEDRERVQVAVNRLLEGNDNYYEEQYRLLCADGRYKYVLGRGFMIREQGKPRRMIGIVQDIDQQVQAIQRLQEQNKGLREIAWMNAHEVRRPVVSILSIAQLFDKSNNDVSLNNQLIEWLYTSTSQLDEIIHKLEAKVKELEKN